MKTVMTQHPILWPIGNNEADGFVVIVHFFGGKTKSRQAENKKHQIIFKEKKTK